MKTQEGREKLKKAESQETQENQRVRLTKMLLKDALTKFLYDKKIEKVSVSELCERAGINRSTFYKHYGSPYDVLDDIEADFFKAAEEMLTLEKDEDQGISGICKLLNFLRSEQEKIYVIIMLNADPDFIKRVFDMPALKYFGEKNYDPEFSDRENEYMRIFEYNGGYAVIREWIATGFKEEPEEIERLLLYVTEHSRKKP